jgi:hypothetical protein
MVYVTTSAFTTPALANVLYPGAAAVSVSVPVPVVVDNILAMLCLPTSAIVLRPYGDASGISNCKVMVANPTFIVGVPPPFDVKPDISEYAPLDMYMSLDADIW